MRIFNKRNVESERENLFRTSEFTGGSMSVQIASGQGSSGSGMGGLMDIMRMFGGGGNSAAAGNPSYSDPTKAWDPQQLQQPDLGDQFQSPLKQPLLAQTGADDQFLSSLGAMNRRGSQIRSGQGQTGMGVGGAASIMSLF